MKSLWFRLRYPLWGAVAALVGARASPAQPISCSIPKVDSATATTQWAPPLDRVVTLRAADLSLRDALDRVAATARLRMSYSAELLPLDRAVCLTADAAPVGRVLAELLAGTHVAAIGVGGDQVVLAPRREQPAAAPRVSEPDMAGSLGMLDRVVVTGSATGSSSLERELTVGLNKIDGRQLERDNTHSLADALDAYVPGVWGWAQPPSTMMSSYASIRGASSFGLSYPKIYIDGIEVANPLLLSRFNAGSIERIEVIRGPQGSALYGSDAISGVVNIVTRHEGAPGDGTRTLIRSTAGVSQSSYTGNVLAQDHSLSIATGTSARSADLNVALGSIGSFVPNGYSRDFMATGSARVVGSESSLSTTARLFVQRAGTPNSPLVVRPREPNDTTPIQSVAEYTLGATGTTMIDSRWTMSLVAGVDGYRLDHVQTNFAPIPSVLDSALKAAEGGADRATVRASSVYQWNAGAPTRATLTISGEHATMRLSTVQSSPLTTEHEMPGSPSAYRAWRTLQPSEAQSTSHVVTWQNSTGIVGQTNLAFRDAFFLTGGVRFEHDSRLAGVDQIETLPMIGVAAVGERGPVTVKLRSSYGKGIRPPTTPSRLQFWQTQSGLVLQDALGPERQSGIESGIDVMVKHAFSFQATRFDQTASGLIQPVALPLDSSSTRMIYVAQNVGQISNRGWEFQATGNVSHLAVSGTLSLVDSRVEKLASGYRGDLITGDRMLQVPARTESMNFTWNAPKWHATLGGSRALDWINYDELRLTQAFASQLHPARDLSGTRLRTFWKQYDGGLRLRAAASRDLRDNFSLEISAENLLNHQTGEPDNITVIPGRTLMTGLKLKF